MKLRVIDRLLAALAGIILIALAVIPLADAVFDMGLIARLAEFAKFRLASHILVMVDGGLILLAVGLACMHLACKRVKRKGFVVQSTDVGELSISIKAIQDLVDKCVGKHDEVHVSSTVLDNTRSGLTIGLRVGLATGVNIPLAVSALQKQIKQYVTACTGVDVHEVKVQVDTTSPKAKASIYAVPDPLGEMPMLPREEEKLPETAKEEAPAEEKEEKCLHQRLFGEEEQPAIVPAPPAPPAEEEPVQEPVEEPAPEVEPEPEAEPEQSAELDTLADLTDGTEPEAAEEEDVLEDLPEMPEEAEGYSADEESLEELKVLDGAEELPQEEPQEETTEE